MKPRDPAVRPSAPEYDVHLTENVMLPMRDGIRMATDIYRPARAGRPLADRRPVLLHRTPFSWEGMTTGIRRSGGHAWTAGAWSAACSFIRATRPSSARSAFRPGSVVHTQAGVYHTHHGNEEN